MGFELAFYLIDHRLIALAMIAVLVVVCEIGFRAGSGKRDAPDSFRSLMSGIGAAMFGLLALLLGFTLAMAISRWDARRDVLVDEANAIGTLSLRAGLFEQPVRDELRTSLREYTDARIALGASGNDLDAWRAARKKSETLHSNIWSAVERAGTRETNPAKLTSLITAANELIDIHELRLASRENFLPASLLLLLLGVAAVAVYFLAWSFGAAGHGGRLAMLLLGLLVGTVLFLIMDVNRPQRGTFQIGVDTLERVGDSTSGSATP
jgi:hypothetical protein